MSRAGHTTTIEAATVLRPVPRMPSSHQETCKVFAAWHDALSDPAIIPITIAPVAAQIGTPETGELILQERLGGFARRRIPFRGINAPKPSFFVTQPERVAVRYSDRICTRRHGGKYTRYQHRPKWQGQLSRQQFFRSERFHSRTLSRTFIKV